MKALILPFVTHCLSSRELDNDAHATLIA